MDRDWANLPSEILAICFYLCYAKTPAVRDVCRTWRRVVDTILHENVTVSRALEGFSNRRFSNARWGILSVPVIVLKDSPRVQMHAGLIARDKNPTVRKSNIEALHRTPALREALQTIGFMRGTHNVTIPEGERRLDMLRPRLLVPQKIHILYKFKLSFAALQSFPGFSRAFSNLFDFCTETPSLHLAFSNEPFFKGDECQKAILADEFISDLPLVATVMQESYVCAIRVTFTETPLPDHVQHLARLCEALVPCPARSRGAFVQESKVCFDCLAPLSVPLIITRAPANAASWSFLEEFIAPPRITHENKLEFLNAIKVALFARMNTALGQLLTGQPLEYNRPDHRACTGLTFQSACDAIRQDVREALRLYTYQGVRAPPPRAIDLAIYVLHCMSKSEGRDVTQPNTRLVLRDFAPGPLGNIQRAYLRQGFFTLCAFVQRIRL